MNLVLNLLLSALALVPLSGACENGALTAYRLSGAGAAECAKEAADGCEVPQEFACCQIEPIQESGFSPARDRQPDSTKRSDSIAGKHENAAYLYGVFAGRISSSAKSRPVILSLRAQHVCLQV